MQGPISSAASSSGSYIAIECKRRTKTDLSAPEVSQVQAAHLDAVPLSFLALRIGDDVLCPWRAIPWETLRTAESVTTDRLRAWEVRSWMGLGVFVL